MFDTKLVGKRIAKLRKEKNLTQLELADEVGVSYQAVSNWERGNSMPDISKLQDLSRILESPIEDILDGSTESKLVEEISKGKGISYMKEHNVDMKEYSNVAALMKPKENEEYVSYIINEQKDTIKIDDLITIAPHVEEDIFKSIIDEIDIIKDIKELIGLAPFLSDELLGEIIDKFLEQGGFVELHNLVGLAPFLEDETLNKIVDKYLENGEVRDLNKIIGLAPFLEEETLDKIINKHIEQGESLNGELTGLYPFLSKEALGKMAKAIISNSSIKNIVSMAPFLSYDQLDGLIDEWIKGNKENMNVNDIIGLCPFLRGESLRKLSKIIVDQLGVGALKYIAPFL